MRFIRDTFTAFFAQVSVAAMLMVAMMLIARYLGPTGFGLYSLVVLIPTMLALFGTLGADLANVYLGGSKKYSWSDLASNSLVYTVTLGSTTFLLALTFVFIVRPSFTSGLDLTLIILSLGMFPCILFKLFFSSILLGQQRIGRYNLIEVVRSSLFLITVAIFCLALSGGVLSAVTSYAVAMLVSSGLAVLLVSKTTKISWSFDLSILRDSLRFGVVAQISSVIGFLNYRLDMFLIAHLSGIENVGYYAVAVVFVELLWYVPNAVGAVIFAITPAANIRDSNSFTPVVCRNTLFVTVMSGVILFTLAEYLVGLLLQPEFAQAVKPMWILIPGVTLLSVPKILGPELNGRGKPWVNTLSTSVSLAVNLPLNLVLIPIMGIEGAAWASTIAYTITTIVTLSAFMRITGNNIFDTVVIRPSDLVGYGRVWGMLRAKTRPNP